MKGSPMFMRKVWAQGATIVEIPGVRVGFRVTGGVDIHPSHKRDTPQDTDAWDSPYFALSDNQAVGVPPLPRGKLGK